MVGDESELLDAFAPSLEEPYHLGICTQVPAPPPPHGRPCP